MLLIKPELVTFKAVCGSSFALQQQAETLTREPEEGLGASLGTGTASRAWQQQGWYPGALCSRAHLPHNTRSSRTRRNGKGMKADGGFEGLNERLAEQAGEERLPLQSEIITANLGLKPDGNARRGKFKKKKKGASGNLGLCGLP